MFVYRFYFYNDFPKTDKISPVYLFERLTVIDYRERFSLSYGIPAFFSSISRAS
jgi:hypothetical protein